MTRAQLNHLKATAKLNKVLRLVNELLLLQEEIALIENGRDFSRAEFIDPLRPNIQKGGYHRRVVPNKARFFDTMGRPHYDSIQSRNKALFGPLAFTVKKLRRKR